MDGTILIADDDRSIRTVLTQSLMRAGCKVHATGSLKTLMQWVREGRGDVVISDVVMPDGNGLDILPEITKLRPHLLVLVISAQSTMETAVTANALSAFDYLAKPFDLPHLLKRCADALAVEHHKSARGLLEQTPADEEQNAAQCGPLPAQNTSDVVLIGKSVQMQSLYRIIAQVLNAPMPLILQGETGSGTSHVAHALHEMSERKKRAFVPLMPWDIERRCELPSCFGGTLVFEHVDQLSLSGQLHVLSLLDDARSKSLRVISTSSTPVATLQDKGMCSALYYRLLGVSVELPALRLREQDILLLAQHFAQLESLSDEVVTLQPEAGQVLLKYHWPGNLHQLRHVMQYAATLSGEMWISQVHVETALQGHINHPIREHDDGTDVFSDAIAHHIDTYVEAVHLEPNPKGLYESVMDMVERPLLEQALERTGGNQVQSAQLLGINRNTLRKKIEQKDIRVTRYPKMI